MGVDERERTARMGIAASIYGGVVGGRGLGNAIGAEGAVAVWENEDHPTWRRHRRRSAVDHAADLEATAACGARFIIPGDDEWPSFPELTGCYRSGQGGAPIGLWVRGNDLRNLDLPGAVAIVGARASTSYGDVVAADIAAGIALGGRTVVSGLAFGIDAAAHRATVGVGGTTVAVLATGIARVYPTAHQQLAEQILINGALISESPPTRLAQRDAFLARNRLIAAMSRATVVVEGATRSGARNTAEWARALRRQVFAVPGPVTSGPSALPHELIRTGRAQLATGAQDITSDMGW